MSDIQRLDEKWECRALPDAYGESEGASELAALPGSHLRWHRLSELTRDDVGTIELLAASCCDGIGIIARWTRREDGTWEVWAWDTEMQGEMTEVVNFGDDEPVPPTPPTVFDDVNNQADRP